MASQKKKKLIGAGIALALMAGVTAGGAIFTYNSTIVGNKFVGEKFDPVLPPTKGKLVVTGDPMTATFSGTNAVETTVSEYLVDNQSESEDFLVDINSYITDGDLQQFPSHLAVRARVNDGAWMNAGTLDSMGLSSDNKFVVKAGETAKVTLEVSVKDLTAYREAGLEAGAWATADWRFDYMEKPATPPLES